MNNWNEPRLFDISVHPDPRGQLGVIEGQNLPFEIKRLYYLFDVPIGAIRGEHGHRTLQQAIICLNGSVEIALNDGRSEQIFNLSTPREALYIPPGLWRRLKFRAPETIVCVLASAPFEKSDYIYDFEEFRRFRNIISDP
ncbi:MAG: FdtA/QdtA family cupin domain-containing protein [Pseudomonadota bacterium]